MNLLFLVEGDQTEPRVYRSWLKHLFPELTFVNRPEDMTQNTCRIIAGGGYPNMVSKPKNNLEPSRLEACLRDIEKFGNIDHFFICVDSEQFTYQERFEEVKSKLDTFQINYKIDSSKVQIHLIIQNCCFETWGLGNAEIPNQYPRVRESIDWINFQNHFDINLNNPETLATFPLGYSFRNKAHLHRRYLQEYLAEFGLKYQKKKPTIISEKTYLEALQKRCRNTEHLPSLKILFDIWEGLKTT